MCYLLDSAHVCEKMCHFDLFFSLLVTNYSPWMGNGLFTDLCAGLRWSTAASKPALHTGCTQLRGWNEALTNNGRVEG